MARNVEIKARIENLPSLVAIVVSIADQGPIEIAQDDTFFHCDKGRLKLRAFSDHEGELIFYERPDQPGPKQSSYIISRTDDPVTLRNVLSLALGQAGRVRKVRTLYLIGRTRVHLDVVEELGEFLELEVVLDENESLESGVAEANDLMVKLNVEPKNLVEQAYIDLLNENI